MITTGRLIWCFIVWRVTKISTEVDAMGLCDFEEMAPCKLKERCPNLMLLSAEASPESPIGMAFDHCICQGTCGDPASCYSECIDSDPCDLRRDVNLLVNEDGLCIPIEECGCFMRDNGVLLLIDEIFVNCSARCTCKDGILVCEQAYQCHSNSSCSPFSNGTVECTCHSGFYGDGFNCALALDCSDYANSGHTEDGTYLITPTNWTGESFEVYCDMNISGGGWTVFQRRVDGSVDFYRDWNDYKNGFGNLNHEHWLGNDKIHFITQQRPYTTLRVDMVSSDDGLPYYADYSLFGIHDERYNYKFTEIVGFAGTAGQDAMEFSKFSAFTTKDRDNGCCSNVYGNCALRNHGGFWYSGCADFNPNGKYNGSGNEGIYWTGLFGDVYSTDYLQFVELKLRPST